MSDSERERKRERRVRFHGRVQFKTIRHVSDFTDKEIGDGFYRKKDFARMSEDVSEIANLVSKGKDSRGGEELCVRGLEHLVEEDVADYRAEKMIASIDAVLDEQDEQRDEDVYDPDIIAQLYSEIVSPLLREAYLVGLRDAQEAAAASAQIPDYIPEKVKAPPRPKTIKKMSSSKLEETPVEEGEEVLHESSDPVDNSKTTPDGNKKAGPPKKKKRIDRTKASEGSPLVRRRDGSYAFRNRADEIAKAEMKMQRKDCVRDSIFKFLDGLDDDEDIIPLP